MSIRPERLRTERDPRRPETPRHRESRSFCANRPARMPIARIRPQDSRICLAISMAAEVSKAWPKKVMRMSRRADDNPLTTTLPDRPRIRKRAAGRQQAGLGG